MKPFLELNSRVVPLLRDDVDTDQIIPAEYLTVTDRSGLADGLFQSWRKDPESVLNHRGDAEILVAGDNFGCGSSREHAPWALLDFGVRCVISTSFADIFYNNCFKNGILPVTVSKDELEALMADAADKENPELTVDLESQEITRPNGAKIKFKIDEFRRDCLLNGLDDIGLTMQKVEIIDAFEEKQRQQQPWLYR